MINDRNNKNGKPSKHNFNPPKQQDSGRKTFGFKANKKQPLDKESVDGVLESFGIEVKKLNTDLDVTNDVLRRAVKSLLSRIEKLEERIRSLEKN